MATVHRRKFLYAVGTGVAAVAVAGGWRTATPGGRRNEDVDRLQMFSRQQYAMGTKVTLTVLHAEQRIASSALDEAFAQIEKIERVCSLYRGDSQLSRLNRKATLRNPDPQLTYLLRQAADWSRRSRGAFDVTVQPLWSLYERADRLGGLPTADEIQVARTCVDWRRVTLNDRYVELEGAGTAVTMNSLAQGYAADQVARILRGRGIHHALVNTGEIGALGNRLDGKRWVAGIQHPRDEDAFAALARLDGRSLATSGDYATTFGGRFETNHLFDPRTGQSPSEVISVSVAATTALEADALSTAIFVLGPEQGSQLVSCTPNADAMIMLGNGRRLTTDGFPLVL